MAKTMSSKKLKSIDYAIIAGLIKNSRLSDRQLGKILHVSQPTVTRRRGQLEKERLLEYTAIPDLKKLGFEILAMTFANWKVGQYPGTFVPKAKDFIGKHPSIIFVSTGRGNDSDRVAISVHRNYSDYAEFMQEIRKEWADYMEIEHTFIIALNSDDVLRPLSFKTMAECLEKEEPEPKVKT
jgi:DNA-binding Lrp family transcriptional regulator